MPTETISKAAFIRYCFFQKENMDADGVAKLWTKEGLAKKQTPTPAFVRSEKTRCLKKYWGPIPFKKNGKFNISEMVRRYFFHNPDHTGTQCIEYFALDGIEFKANHISQVKHTDQLQGRAGKNGYAPPGTVVPNSNQHHAAGSPDPNHNTGPRARKRSKPGRRKRSQSSLQQNLSSPLTEAPVRIYEEIEAKLDALLRQAEDLQNSPLAHALRAARRQASVEYCAAEKSS